MLKDKLQLKIKKFGVFNFKSGITVNAILKELNIKDKIYMVSFNGKLIDFTKTIDKSGELEFYFTLDAEPIWKESNYLVKEYLTSYLKKEKLIEKEVDYMLNEEEFYVDYVVKKSLSENQLAKFENEVLKMIKKIDDQKFFFADQIKYIKFHNLSGVETEENYLINRIYGFALMSEDQFIKREAKIRERDAHDHRKIAKNLDIFFISPEVGKGLPIWLPNGVRLKSVIRNFILEQEKKYDYEVVETPVLGSIELYKTSGHYYHYRENMFPLMKISDQETFAIRPMACPHHIMIFKYKPRTYREMPKRYSEQVYQFRYEPSGSLLGLERVRAMNLSDSHVFMRPDQLNHEIEIAYDIVENTLNKFQIKIDYIELALHDPMDNEKYHGDPKMWDQSEQVLKNFLTNKKIKFVEKVGEAAFYGPKIDIQIKSSLGHNLTVSTIQLDFFLPEKFDVHYLTKDLKKERVIMIHRGLIGTYERFISILLEQTKGHFPLWLAPIQVVVLPISQKHHKYAEEINQVLKDRDIRTILDQNDDRLSYKIRNYQLKKINIQIIIGDKELKNKTVSYRFLGEDKTKEATLKEFLLLFK